MKWATLILINVAMAPVGGMLALYLSAHQFQRFVAAWDFWRCSAFRSRWA